MTPQWVRIERPHRCQNCGELVAITWRWYPTPTTSTLAYCEPCVTVFLSDQPKEK